ncbi:hypothetical protein BVIET440_60124 [Burkholderia vietnamiensis]|nr:hypothetical protein BVI2075_250051 [Burkholderia vietnamiensis]CAG9215075.1 hypothetical protein BVI1335_2630006 [Burkholderia vietnamiensis]
MAVGRMGARARRAARVQYARRVGRRSARVSPSVRRLRRLRCRRMRRTSSRRRRAGARRADAAGGRKGYARWMFRPVKGGLWRTLDEPDDTLDADGGRQPPCPIPPRPWRPSLQRAAPVRYRLGEVRRILMR